MQIQIIHTTRSFVNMDAVISHGEETIVIPMNYRFTSRALFNDPNQLVAELNQHWSRRTEDSNNKIFKLYRCIARCWDNHEDFKTGKLSDYDVLVESVAPYMLELLTQHNIGLLAQHMDSWYGDVIPTDLPSQSHDPHIYTYGEYQELQAMLLSIRSIFPVLEMLLSVVPDYPAEDKLMRIHASLLKRDTALYESTALYRLHAYILAFMAKNGASGDSNVLLTTLLYKRLTHYPLTSAPRGTSIIVNIYKFLSMAVHPENRERSHRAMEKVLSERNK